MISKYRNYLQPVLAIIAQPFLSWNPHILTMLSAIFAGLFALFLSWHLFFWAGVSWIGVTFDAIDGYVARKSNKVSPFGAFFDSTMDRIADFFYISAFGFAGLIPWSIVSIGIITALLISYARARTEALVDRSTGVAKGMMQRTERLVSLFVTFVLFAFGFYQFALILFVLFVVLNSISVLERILLAKRLLS